MREILRVRSCSHKNIAREHTAHVEHIGTSAIFVVVLLSASLRVSVLVCYRVSVLACRRVSMLGRSARSGSHEVGDTRPRPPSLCWLHPRCPRCFAGPAQPCTARGKNSSIRGCRDATSNGCCEFTSSWVAQSDGRGNYESLSSARAVFK